MSGNPSGRPRTKVISDAYRALLSERVPNDPQGRTYAELIALAAIKKALSGDASFLRELTDRTEGKPTQPISGPDHGPIEIHSLTPDQRDSQLAALAAELGYRKE